MTQATTLPPGCILRRARFTDKWAIAILPIFGITKDGSLWRYICIAIIVSFHSLLLPIFVIGLFVGISLLFESLKRSELSTLALIEILIFIWCFPVFIRRTIDFFRPRNWSRFWIVKCNGLLVGYGVLSRHRTYSMLDYLYVAPGFRYQGLGSCLVKPIVQKANKPLYLFCRPGLVKFYARFGFVSVPKQNLIRNIWLFRFKLIPAFILVPLVINQSITASSSNRVPSTHTTGTLPHNRILRPAEAGDRWKICRFIFTSLTTDLFLPFGFTPPVVSAVVVLLFLAFLAILILLTFIAYLVGRLYWITSLFAGTLLMPVLLLLTVMIAACLQMQDWSKFYLVESNSQLIAYARIRRYKQYSVLHHIQIASSLDRQSLTTELMQHLAQEITKPIYLACPAELVNFYTRIGFTSVTTQALPQTLKFGASLNLKLGGTNLILR